MSQDLTTLICLFHHKDQAQAALEDVLEAGVPEANVTLLRPGSAISSQRSTLSELNVPEKDIQRLLDGLSKGGAVVSVSAISDHVEKVEDIFEAHKAGKIDEAVVDDDMSVEALPFVSSPRNGAIPVVEEELVVGKRIVDAGGVRLYRRVVEIPVEESVSLREEHVVVDRRPVDRDVTEADLALQGAHTIELTETAEEAVVSKNARVVEEVLVGKGVTQHEEHIRDKVRHTEVKIEEVPPAYEPGVKSQTY